MTAASTIWAVVPAAGYGRRFRQAAAAEQHDQTPQNPDEKHLPADTFKQLQPLGTKTVLTRIMDELLACPIEGLCVVVNPAIASTVEQLHPADDRCIYAINPDPHSEMIESVQIGLAGIAKNRLSVEDRHPSADVWPSDWGVLIVPGDHPGITRAVIERCVGQYNRQDGRCMVIAAHRGKRGHPLIIPGDLVRQVWSWSPQGRLNRLREQYPDRVVQIEVNEPGIMINIDRPGDLDRTRKLEWAQKPKGP